jgi:isoleucyl-tRNA synthetase
MSVDYKSTVFLPRTNFPMRGGLPELEPKLLRRWQAMELWRRLRETSKGREKFILHDGPPYANGHLHIGHALNKILKDVVNRSQQMLGRDANYVPGWDCHGLPIEWKIEEDYRAKGKDKDAVPIGEFRRECRDFADKWIDIQRAEFKRLGVEGDWANPYSTMSYAAEAQIVREIGKFALNGALFRGARPVMWSVVEKTALAEAEIEYHDHKSATIHVAFPVVRASRPALAGAAIVIWTTTPWTLPGNRAIAYGPEIAYVAVLAEAVAEGTSAKAGATYVVAEALVPAFLGAAKITAHRVTAKLTAADLAGTSCRHPLRGHPDAGGGYDFDVPLLAGGFVTTDAGTGFVHIAPGHGADDYELGIANGIAVPDTVGADGSYFPHVPLFAGKRVYTPEGKPGDANGAVIKAMAEAGCLVGKGSLVHSYPHSWRSKAPLIFRNTPQWFISMEKTGLRKTALAAIDATRFVPESGRNRLYSMIEQRPDWCISRQRAWGVPIAVFVDRRTGEVLRDQSVNDRVAEAFETEGADAWYDSDPKRFLGNRDPADYEQVRDIVDVWFDSGSTHSYVLEARPDLAWPASLYLEGSDQHRGWFHSSLLEACGTRGRAPYDAVLTHGFVLDEQGRKMSKSLGNVTAPQEVVDRYGADILRLWVVGSDYSEDLRIGPDILKYQADLYRRLRNTLRYLLGALDGFAERERLPAAEMPELERWVLHRLWQLDRIVRRAVDDFDFHTLFTEIHNFCTVDLSAFYFDIRKDALYCDRPDAPRRRAARTVLDEVFSCLTAWLAPVLCFTVEEAWLHRLGQSPDDPADANTADSVHLRVFPDVPAAWRDDALAEKWERVRALRRVVTGALELERAGKKIGSSLQAHPKVHATAAHVEAMAGIELAEIAITSDATLVEGSAPSGAFTLPDVAGIGVTGGLAEGAKCERCWKVLPEVGTVAGHDGLCRRCADAVEHRVAAIP